MSKESPEAKFQISLSAEYEQRFMERISDLTDTVIQQKIERASIQKKYISQTDLKIMFQIGQKVIDELQDNGLSRVKLGRKIFYDLEELDVILQQKYKI